MIQNILYETFLIDVILRYLIQEKIVSARGGHSANKKTFFSRTNRILKWYALIFRGPAWAQLSIQTRN